MATFTLLNVPIVPHIPLWTAVGRDGKICYSSDAVNWSEYQAPIGTSTDYWDIAFGQKSGADWWVISRDNATELLVSLDPTAGAGSWTTLDIAGSHATYATEYGANGTWISAAKSTQIHRSTDGGTTWAQITPGVVNAGTQRCIATNGTGTWVIGCSSKTIKSSDDGLTWSESFTNGGAANKVEYYNGLWAITGDGSQSWYTSTISNDNIADTWTTLNLGSRWGLCHVSETTWIIGDKTAGGAYISTDNFVTWTSVSDPGVGQIMDFASDGVTIVAVGKGNKIATSTDNGSTWTERFTATQDLLVVEFNKVKPF